MDITANSYTYMADDTNINLKCISVFELNERYIHLL